MDKSIHEELIKIENKLDRIERLLIEHIEPKCTKMSEHIDFIEYVYEYLKRPLFFVANRINKLSTDTIKIDK